MDSASIADELVIKKPNNFATAIQKLAINAVTIVFAPPVAAIVTLRYSFLTVKYRTLVY